MDQNRFKSLHMWTAILAQVLSILGILGLYDKIGITEPDLQAILTGFLQMLVLLGILNNPTRKDEW